MNKTSWFVILPIGALLSIVGLRVGGVNASAGTGIQTEAAAAREAAEHDRVSNAKFNDAMERCLNGYKLNSPQQLKCMDNINACTMNFMGDHKKQIVCYESIGR